MLDNSSNDEYVEKQKADTDDLVKVEYSEIPAKLESRSPKRIRAGSKLGPRFRHKGAVGGTFSRLSNEDSERNGSYAAAERGYGFYSKLSRGKQGYPPTVREIAGHFGIDYRAAVDHLRALEKKGSVTRSSKSRGIQVFRPFSAVQHIPVVGKVTAGPPLTAVENIEGTIPVPEEWAKGSSLFIVRVDREGMSMLPTILPQDYLLVKQGTSCDDGAIVLVMIDGEVTVKRLFREKQGVVLKSDNPAMPPIRVKEREKSFRVLGKVVGVAYRKL